MFHGNLYKSRERANKYTMKIGLQLLQCVYMSVISINKGLRETETSSSSFAIYNHHYLFVRVIIIFIVILMYMEHEFYDCKD